MDKFIDLIKLFIQSPKLLIVPVVLVFVTHWFARKRKIDELLFNSRKKIYATFISEYSSGFSYIGPKLETLISTLNHLETKSETKIISAIFEARNLKAKHDHKVKVSEVFSSCRLVAGSNLERKLRCFYEFIYAVSENNHQETKINNILRGLVGYEIEALMRYDLKVISFFELFLLNMYIKQLYKKLNKKITKLSREKNRKLSEN